MDKPRLHQEDRVGIGIAFGTFGELLQGVLPEADRDFLVTFPIARYSRALFASDVCRADVRVYPVHKAKSRRLTEALLQDLGLPPGGMLILDSEVPEGKGMASSSADLVASARAVCDCFGLPVPMLRLQRCMQRVEPSDGVMYPGVVAFYHRQVQLRECLGTLPPITVVAGDEGGVVDTLQFNRIAKPFTAADKAEYAVLLARMTRAVRDHDLTAIGQVATRSAVMNQKLNPKRSLPDMVRLAERVGAPGVAVAHSGTCVGILLAPGHPRHAWQLQVTCEAVHELTGNLTVHSAHDFAKMGW